ncbi:ubiquinone biosynthesis protein COQ4 homolog, mitochondrial-like [Ornithodoros turicata]|uniref:ubiquinone biosynthesis protein COQ4 homolog, mitochondrial-like n=1 Tax=Ornithodoros turicata TaxID=34597 RepID=UPI00313A3520
MSCVSFSRLARRIPLANAVRYGLTSCSSCVTQASNVDHHGHESETDSNQSPLYDGHIPTTFFQKTILSVGSALAAITDPFRDDMVAVMGEVTGVSAFKHLFEVMSRDPEGMEILRDRPRINTRTVDLSYLKQLPTDTFGYAYYQFLLNNNVTPDTRLPVQFVDDADLAYVAQRYREVHDLVHTLLEMPTNMLGEVTVKWVEAIHTKMPMCATGALFGALRLKPKQRKAYTTRHLPWALQVGYSGKNLMCVYYEKHWEQPMRELQHQLNIKPLPEQ